MTVMRYLQDLVGSKLKGPAENFELFNDSTIIVNFFTDGKDFEAPTISSSKFIEPAVCPWSVYDVVPA